MHGEGHRRRCPECGQALGPDLGDGRLSRHELRGPRNITSSNIDRAFDDNGRLLFIEEKHTLEPAMKMGQWQMLLALASLPRCTVWVVKGDTGSLTVFRLDDSGYHEIVVEGGLREYQRAVDAWYDEPRRQLSAPA